MMEKKQLEQSTEKKGNNVSFLESSAISIFLCGDVMTGRGIDQVMPHPSRPDLHESYVKDARYYVRLDENKGASIPAPVP